MRFRLSAKKPIAASIKDALAGEANAKRAGTYAGKRCSQGKSCAPTLSTQSCCHADGLRAPCPLPTGLGAGPLYSAIGVRGGNHIIGPSRLKWSASPQSGSRLTRANA
jgi:hypothetical protein